jgi:hypothetical protein
LKIQSFSDLFVHIDIEVMTEAMTFHLHHWYVHLLYVNTRCKQIIGMQSLRGQQTIESSRYTIIWKKMQLMLTERILRKMEEEE